MPAYQRTPPYMMEPHELSSGTSGSSHTRSKADRVFAATRMAEIIAQHEARGCTCHSCTVRHAKLSVSEVA